MQMRGQRGKVAFFSQRGSALLVVTAVALLLFSCGLPTSDYLYPPAHFLSPSSNIVRLIHDTSNIDYSDIAALFKGYEIYYRVFDSETDANISYNYLYNNLTSSNISTVASSKGYYVLVKYNDSSAPLIPVSDNSYDYFDLNLNASSRWTITTEVGSTTTTLSSVFRDKDDSTTTTSSDADFYVSGQYSSDDHDYEGDGVSSGSSVYIVFFAVSYGVSSSLNDFYSEPIVLEPITYTPGS
jgi:hypothetical protein